MSLLQKGSGAEGGVVELSTDCAYLDFHYLIMRLEWVFSLFWVRGVIFSVAWGFYFLWDIPSAVQCPGSRALIFLAGNATPSDSIVAVAKWMRCVFWACCASERMLFTQQNEHVLSLPKVHVLRRTFSHSFVSWKKRSNYEGTICNSAVSDVVMLCHRERG